MMQDDIPLPQKLALAHSATVDRLILAPFFLLDSRLTQFVSQSKEPILTQMRIAWWRDQLRKPVHDRPAGDPALDALSYHWVGEEAALIGLVDGWEALLAEPPLPSSAARECAVARGHCFGAIARLCALPSAQRAATNAGIRWAYADLAARIDDRTEREYILSHANIPALNDTKLPYRLRSLSILNALASKTLINKGGPLITGRADIFTVMRVGLLGR